MKLWANVHPGGTELSYVKDTMPLSPERAGTVWETLPPGEPSDLGSCIPNAKTYKTDQGGSRQIEADQVNVCILKRLKNL